ncbi:MAG: amidohydrolase family protein, partial [Alphaproteobacteria bacterium]|nr:amidohydrolase family protein [Alphaproteobacteria bacterium]
MKDGMRFVDCDMHIMEPVDLFDRYLDREFRDRVTLPIGADGKRTRGMIVIDGQPTAYDLETQQHRKPHRGIVKSDTSQPLSGSRIANSGRLDFAIERGYDSEAQLMGMEMEGIDIAVLFPTMGLSLLARDGMDPWLSMALSQAYNNWVHEFCQHSPDQMKFAAMLPPHDVNLACAELVRCVTELGAVGSFVRPNCVDGHFWHSNYWNPLFALHE